MAFDISTAKAITITPRQGGGFDISSAKPVSEEAPVPQGLQRAALQGATFGAGDELTSGLTAGVYKAGEALGLLPESGQSLSEMYGQQMQQEQQRLDQYRQQEPGKALAAELAGGLLTGGAGASKLAALKGVQALRPAAQAATIGATEGATYGYLSGKPGERAESAAIGGIGGAIGAPALQAAGRVGADLARPLVSRVKNAITGSAATDARNYLAAGLGRESVDSLQEILPDARAGNLATLADMSEAARGQLEGLITEADSPAIKKMARQFLGDRNRQQMSRVFDMVDEDIGTVGRTFADTIKELKRTRNVTAAPLYDAARQKPIKMTQYMKAVMHPERGSPEVISAMKTAQQRVRTKRLTGEKVSNIDVIDEMKRVLDDDIKSLYRNGKNNRARDLVKIKNRVLNDVDAQIPEYKAARNSYAGDSDLLNAAEEGTKILRADVDYLNDIVRTMSDSEKSMFRVGAKKAIREKLMQAREGTNSINRIASEINLERIKKAFPSEASFNRFKSDIQFEAKIFDTERVLHNSMTALRQSEQRALQRGIDFDIPDEVGAGVSGMIASGIRRIMIRKLSPEAKENLARLLLTPINQLDDDVVNRINKTVESKIPEQYRKSFRTMVDNLKQGAEYSTMAAPGVIIGASQ
jgi:hypothetical protein